MGVFGFCAALLSLPVWPAKPSFTAMCIISILLLFCYYKYHQTLYLGVALGGVIVWAYMNIHQTQQALVYTERNHTLVIYVQETQTYQDKIRLHAQVETGPKWLSQARIRLNWYLPKVPVLAHDTHQIYPKVGERWSVEAKLKPLHRLLNQGGFDYAAYLLGQQIVASGYIKPKGSKRLTTARDYRARLINFYDHHWPSYHWSRALLFGESTPNTDMRVLQLTGTAHLFVISGLHVGIVVWLCYVLCQVAGCRKQSWCYTVLCAAAVFGYMYIAGFGLSVTRAGFMLALWLLLQRINCHVGYPTRLLLTVCAIVLWFPEAGFQTGFWLSFGAVSTIFILLWCLPQNAHRQPTKEAQPLLLRCLLVLRLHGLLAVLLIPFSVWFFGVASYHSVFANLILIPFFTFCLVPFHTLTLFSIMGEHWLGTELGAHWLLSMAQWSLQHVFVALEWLAQQGGYHQDVAFISVVLFALIIGLVSAWRYRAYHWCILSLCGLCLLGGRMLHPPMTRLTFLAVGQGSAAIYHRGDSAILFDVGPAYSRRFNSWESVIKPHLRSQGISRLEAVFISHWDRDHAGALTYLLQAHPHVTVFAPQKQAPTALAFSPCEKNMSWQFGKLEVTSLWPKRARGRNKNDRSCVLSLAINGHTVLLPGDISKVVERQLVHSGLTQHDVLAVPHHGSLSSSLPAFIDRVQPNLAVFSTGYLNRWSFPKDTVVARYQAAQSRPLNTACDGAVTLTFDGPFLQISTFRQAYPKWYYPNC